MRHHNHHSSSRLRHWALVASVLVGPWVLGGCADSPTPQATVVVPPAATLDSLIQEASHRFNVPEKWIRAVMRQESGGRVHIVSKKGAMGLMQLMPGTWALMRDAYKLGNDPYEPHDNIMAGTAYLREMYDLFGSPGFLAAYNAGPGRYENHLKTQKPLPAETRHYVAVIYPQIQGLTPNGPGPARATATRSAPVVVAALRTPAPAMAPVRAVEPARSAPSAPALNLSFDPVPVPAKPVQPAAKPVQPAAKPMEMAALEATPARPAPVRPAVAPAVAKMPPPLPAVRQVHVAAAAPAAVKPARAAVPTPAPRPVQMAAAGLHAPKPLPAARHAATVSHPAPVPVRRVQTAQNTQSPRLTQLAHAEGGSERRAGGNGVVYVNQRGTLPPGWYVPVADAR